MRRDAACGYETIGPREAVRRLGVDGFALVADVRSARAFARGHASEALSLPFAGLDFTGGLPWPFSELDRDDPVLVYCYIGVASARVCAQLAQAGFTQVVNVRFGHAGLRLAEASASG